jgi:hypothetical protein
MQLHRITDFEAMTFEDILADRIIYENPHKLRNKLALVDETGKIYGVLDDEDIDVDDSDNVSLSEDRKSPVNIRAIEPPNTKVNSYFTIFYSLLLFIVRFAKTFILFFLCN